MTERLHFIENRGWGLCAYFIPRGRSGVLSYERHSGHCRPGLWNVFAAIGSEAERVYDAVVDDFGDLVRVS